MVEGAERPAARRARMDVCVRSARAERSSQRTDQLHQSVASITSTITGSSPTPADVRAVLAVAPSGIRRSFIAPDNTRAQILFAIGPVSLDRRKTLVAELEAALHPPPGVSVTASGLAVVGTEAVTSLTANRERMSYVALIAVLLWLLLAFRSGPRERCWCSSLSPPRSCWRRSSSICSAFHSTPAERHLRSDRHRDLHRSSACSSWSGISRNGMRAATPAPRSRPRVAPHRPCVRSLRVGDRCRFRGTRAVGLPAAVGLRNRRGVERARGHGVCTGDPAAAPHVGGCEIAPPDRG